MANALKPTAESNAKRAPAGRAFSLTEILVMLVILGVTAALIAPQFAGASEDARTSRAETTIAGVRSAIAAFARRSAAQNAPPFPSIAELTTPGIVVRDTIPANPFNGLSRVQLVSRPQAESRAVVNAGSAGWNYFVDNTIDPPLAIFYANSDSTTTAPDADGNPLPASGL